MGVEGMAVVLANRYQLDVERVHLAALLHDLTKPFSEEKQRKLLAQVSVVELIEEDVEFPALWHGYIAAQEAADVYGISDEEILQAVAFHSTGAANFGPVGLALYVADFTEPSRHWRNVSKARAEVLGHELVDAARVVMNYKLQKLEKKGRSAHRRTLEMGEWLGSTGQ